MDGSKPARSPWVHQWEDSVRRELYISQTKDIAAQAAEREVYAKNALLEYAKWILASLIAVHGGAIYAISNLRGKVPAPADAELLRAAIFNGAGIVFALLTAVFAFSYFGFLIKHEIQYRDPALLVRDDKWPDEWKYDPLAASNFLSIVCGITSIAMFIASLWTVSNAL